MRSSSKIYWGFFGLAVLLFIFLQYFGLLYYHYPVPPGHDAMMHWWIIKPIFESKTTFTQIWGQGGYPPGFHYFIAFLAHLFHTDPMNVMLWFCPSILVLAGLSIFWFAYRTFNPNVALASFVAYAFLAKTPLQQLNDGGYPNLIAAQILLPIFLMLLFETISAKTWGSKILLIISTFALLVLIGLVHHISFFYAVGILLLFIPLYVVYALLGRKITALTAILSLFCTLVVYILLFFAYKNLKIFAPFRSLSNSMVTFTSSFPFLKVVGIQDQEALIGLFHYPSYLGSFLSLYALIGFILGIFSFRKWPETFRLGFITITAFGVLLFGASRLKFLTNPDRLVRDLAVPLTIFAGMFFAELYNYLSQLHLRSLLKPITVTIMVVLIIIPLFGRLKKALAYEPMVRFTSADLAAISYLKQQPPGKLLVEGYDFYFERFLPDWQIGYIWFPQTYQPPEIHPLDPATPTELVDLKQFNYVYIVDNQTGWTPSAIKFDFAKKYLGNESFELLAHEKSPVNEIYLFKVKQ